MISFESENGQPLFNIDAGMIRNIFYNNAEAIDHYINVLASRGYKLGDKIVDHKTSTVISISGFDCLPGTKKTVKHSDVSYYFASEDDTFEIEIEEGFKKLNDQNIVALTSIEDLLKPDSLKTLREFKLIRYASFFNRFLFIFKCPLFRQRQLQTLVLKIAILFKMA